KPIPRRDVLKGLGSAGAGALLNSRQAPHAQNAAIRVAGRPVEIAVTSVSAKTARLSIVPLENGKPQPIPPFLMDGSLAQQTWPKPVVRLTTLAREQSVRAGELLVKLSPEPLTIRVATADGQLIQQLRPDQQTGALSFLIGDKPVLAFGQGGPQFDRRGSTY